MVLADVHLCGSALGTHLAHLLRRVQRLAMHYGSRPQYLLTSAPLAHIAAVADDLTGQTCTLVGAQRSHGNPNTALCWPPLQTL